MKNDRIENLLDELSSGLQADPEMRMDVKSELRTHLDDKIAEGENAGLSETESSEQALKSFGDIVAIADGLVAANASRMKLKARLWRVAAILLIPAVIICAFISFFQLASTVAILDIMSSFNSNIIKPPTWMKRSAELFGKSYTADECFILDGDTTKHEPWQQQKALSDRFPSNKVYLANYILQLINAVNNKKVTRQYIYSELKRAEKLDPDNAFYNYMLAGVMLQKACSYKTQIKSLKDGKKKRKRIKEIIDFKINDRQLFKQAMQEYLAGTKKKHCHSYSMQLMRQRLNIMGEPTNFATNLDQIMFAAGTVIPHVSLYRKLTQVLPQYAKLLIKEQTQELALRYIQSWHYFLQHQLDDSDYFISVLVLIASAKRFADDLPSLYQELGKKQQAGITKTQLLQVIEVREIWEKGKYDYRKDLNKMSILGSMILPALGIKFSEQDLASSRRIEYINVEKSVIVILNILFIGGMLVAIGVIVTWRWRTGINAILLTPPLRTIGKIFLWGIITPIAAYLLISTLGTIGGHQYNLLYNSAFYFQILLLLTLMPYITFHLAKKYVSNRCQQLEIGLPAHKRWGNSRIIILWSSMAILTVAALIPHAYIQFGKVTSYTFFTAIGLTFIYLLLIIVHTIAKFLTSFHQRQYAIYYGALAKTLLPIFASAVIFLTFTCIPYLNWREANLIKQDKIIFGAPGAFTHAEEKTVAYFKAQLEKALNSKPK
ncbi:MAG: permease prefix domain 1-containing protein [Victivallaceae bacterium]|nr:permease prefix domain 1-containing protein [Victivallaceae bacterium]